MKYRRELTPNIKFQADRIFVRNDLFEQVIKDCKSNSTEFLMFKEKLGICLYEKNYYKEEIIKMQDQESIEVISKVSTKKLKNQTINQIKDQIMNQLKDQIMNQLKKLIKNQKKNQLKI